MMTRTFLHLALSILLAISHAYMAWKALSLLTNSSSPVMVVISESMAPAFHRGDLLLLSNWKTHIHIGDIPVVWFEGAVLPMVHRAVESRWQSTGEDLV
jgi:signal peptidase